MCNKNKKQINNDDNLNKDENNNNSGGDKINLPSQIIQPTFTEIKINIKCPKCFIKFNAYFEVDKLEKTLNIICPTCGHSSIANYKLKIFIGDFLKMDYTNNNLINENDFEDEEELDCECDDEDCNCDNKIENDEDNNIEIEDEYTDIDGDDFGDDYSDIDEDEINYPDDLFYNDKEELF
jgi:hypothetical protein